MPLSCAIPPAERRTPTPVARSAVVWALRTPTIYIIAGPNGAREFLPRTVGCLNFINADLIAQGLSPFDPESAALPAGRIMLRQIDDLVSRRVDFAFETTLSGRGWVPMLRRAKERGYRIELHFMWLPRVEESISRVALRVKKGGHNIPRDVIQRRFQKGISNLFNVYRPLLDSWVVYENSAAPAQEIAAETAGELRVLDRYLFEKICAAANVSS